MPLFPSPNNVTGVSSLMEYMNLVTSDIFGLMILIPLWIILFFSMLRWRPEWAFASASAMCLVLSVLMSIINMTGFRVILGFMLLTGGSAVYIWLKKSEY